MKTSIHVPAVLALVFGAAALFAQEKEEKKEPSSVEKLMTSVHEQLCPKGGKCEGAKKETCDHVVATAKASHARYAEKWKKMGLEKCWACTNEAKDGGPCGMCREWMIKILVPWIKKQAETKDAKHTQKWETLKCTLRAGPDCKGCVERMSDALVKKHLEIREEHK